MAFTNITAISVETGSAILAWARLAFVNVSVALTACIPLWTTAKEIAIGCVTELIYGTCPSILTRIICKKKNVYILCIFQRWALKHLSFALRSGKAVKSKLTDAVSLFDCGSGAVLTLPALVTDFGPRLLVTRVVSLTVHRGDTEYRALVPVIVGLTLYPHGQSQPG